MPPECLPPGSREGIIRNRRVPLSYPSGAPLNLWRGASIRRGAVAAFTSVVVMSRCQFMCCTVAVKGFWIQTVLVLKSSSLQSALRDVPQSRDSTFMPTAQSDLQAAAPDAFHTPRSRVIFLVSVRRKQKRAQKRVGMHQHNYSGLRRTEQ